MGAFLVFPLLVPLQGWAQFAGSSPNWTTNDNITIGNTTPATLNVHNKIRLNGDFIFNKPNGGGLIKGTMTATDESSVGSLNVEAADANSAQLGLGGNLNLSAGDNTLSSTTGFGGNVTIRAGFGATGSSAKRGAGAEIQVLGGNKIGTANTVPAVPDQFGVGGDLKLKGGAGGLINTLSGKGAELILKGGVTDPSGIVSRIGGDALLTAGFGGTIGGKVIITGGGVAGSSVGGDVLISGGNSAAANRPGGNIYLDGGGIPFRGNIYMQSASTTEAGNRAFVGTTTGSSKLNVAKSFSVIHSEVPVDDIYRNTTISDIDNWAAQFNGFQLTGTKTSYTSFSSKFGLISRDNTETSIKDGYIEWRDKLSEGEPSKMSLQASNDNTAKFRFVFRNLEESSFNSNVNSDGQLRNEVMTLTAKGQVGIAQSNPFGKLQVEHVVDLESEPFNNPRNEIGLGIVSYMRNAEADPTAFETDVVESVAIHGANQTNFFTRSTTGGSGSARIAVGTQGIAQLRATESTAGFTQVNIGVRGSAYDAPRCYGVYGQSTENASPTAGGDLPAGKWGVYSNGDFGTNGGTYFGSDKELKTQISIIKNPTDILNALQPKMYFFKNDKALKSLSLDTKRKQYGLIAQDVEKILPELVKGHDQFAIKSPDGKETYPEVSYKMVNYNAFIPILIAGFQEQQIMIASLKSTVDSLFIVAQKANSIRRMSLDEVLANKVGTAVLFPNPNDGKFSISITDLDDTQVTDLYVTNLAGAIIFKASSVKNGNLNIDLSHNSKGIYQYTLFTNKQEIASNKFVVE